MAILTLSVLEGLERGLVYEDLETPVTIGREEDNVIQLNDERVSRVHAKLQEDRSQVILTDLHES
jgi:pSer/pThr/pTyr-binding forkhead associated (FHA) protein